MMSGPKITDDKARKILQRAAEIDRVASESVSVETLRAAAREAGIAEASFEAAVAEITTAAAPEKHSPGNRGLKAKLTIVAVTAAALFLLFGFIVPTLVVRVPAAPPADVSLPKP